MTAGGWGEGHRAPIRAVSGQPGSPAPASPRATPGGHYGMHGWNALRSGGRIGRSIFAVGGFVAPVATAAAVERYDIDRDPWRRLPALPIPVNVEPIAVRGDRRMVEGDTGALQRYDPRRASGSCCRRRPPCGDRPGDPRRQALRGWQGRRGKALSTLEVYDVTARRWRTAPPMRVPREHIAAVATSGDFYVFGGRAAGRTSLR